MSDDPQAQGEQPQDQQAPPEPAAPPVETPAAPPVGDGPWAAKLNEVFSDPATRGQVDQFLRQEVQPYTTRLEQQAASVNADAARLYEDLSQNPNETTFAIINELYGEQAAQQFAATLQAQQQAQPDVQQGQLDPRLTEVADWVEQKRAAEQYDAEVARVVSENPAIAQSLPPGVDFGTAIADFVVAAGGDFDQAVTRFQEWRAAFGQPAQAAPPAEAPPVMDNNGTETPPIEQKHQTLDEAMADFMAEQRAAKAPPVVGTS
jgi:hypothetical protein